MGILHRNVEDMTIADTRKTSQSESPPHSPPPPPSPPPAPPSPPQADPVYAPPRDSPPIITYPEFLTTSPHVTPLITKPRLLTTLYLFSSLSFLLYGTSTYLVTPMLESLTSSRLSLFATASENLSKLVSRLEGLVSEIPVTTPGKKSATLETPYKDADEDSDSDPTELFHRDIGVQTSLPSTPASPTLSPVTSNLESQRHTLTSLKSSIQSLIEDDTDSANENQELEATVSVLKEYCEQLAYVVPVPTYGFSSYASSAKPEDKNDEIAKAKAAIRSVKGVLLSARSFPGGVRATAR